MKEFSIFALTTDYAKEYLDLQKALDRETDFMIYEPYERKASVNDVVGHIKSIIARDTSEIFVARLQRGILEKQVLVGYLGLFGGRQNRLADVCSLSCGVLREYQGQGVMSCLWEAGLKWAHTAGVHRIELTVQKENYGALSMYYHWGFSCCGVYRDRLNFGGGKRVTEYILEAEVERLKNGSLLSDVR